MSFGGKRVYEDVSGLSEIVMDSFYYFITFYRQTIKQLID